MKNNVNDKFVEYFSEFKDCYVVIGGTALSIVTTLIGLTTRATKDYDLVLIEENLTKEFMDRFHKFVEDAGYNQYKKLNDSKHSLYRFDKPTNKDFPEMIEIYSRNPIDFKLSVMNQRRPIAFDGADSLSALLLSDEYYSLIKYATLLSGEGLRYLSIGYLIVFKAKAWLDLTLRKELGEKVKSSDIKKHINDVFQLAQGLTGNELLHLNEIVVEDMKKFIQSMNESEIDYAINIRSAFSKEETVEVLVKLFCDSQILVN